MIFSHETYNFSHEIHQKTRKSNVDKPIINIFLQAVIFVICINVAGKMFIFFSCCFVGFVAKNTLLIRLGKTNDNTTYNI